MFLELRITFFHINFLKGLLTVKKEFIYFRFAVKKDLLTLFYQYRTSRIKR